MTTDVTSAESTGSGNARARIGLNDTKESNMNCNIRVLPFPGIVGGYVIISACKSDKSNGVSQRLSYFFDGGKGVGAEWEPEHGPLTRITSCAEDWKGEYSEAQPHWFYPFFTGNGDWSQCAVDDTGIARYLLRGDYVAMFAVLAKFAD